ncbi:hypothetical protein KGY71_04800 [Candidatus Bipolaricaulota bacterium]|nr:hypothetical protein [Candidatus Bipolaricaulota bacterium]
MRKGFTGRKTAFEGETTGTEQVTSSRCPDCGGKMVASTRQARAGFPGPPLERRECEENSCNYSKFVRVDSGVTGTNSRNERKGLK